MRRAGIPGCGSSALIAMGVQVGVKFKNGYWLVTAIKASSDDPDFYFTIQEKVAGPADWVPVLEKVVTWLKEPAKPRRAYEGTQAG